MSETPKKKREPRKIQKLELRDRSCTPGAWLCDLLCMDRHHEDDDTEAIVEAWNPAHFLRGLIVSASVS